MTNKKILIIFGSIFLILIIILGVTLFLVVDTERREQEEYFENREVLQSIQSEKDLSSAAAKDISLSYYLEAEIDGEKYWEEVNGNFNKSEEDIYGEFIYDSYNWKADYKIYKFDKAHLSEVIYDDGRIEDWAVARSRFYDFVDYDEGNEPPPLLNTENKVGKNRVLRSELDYIDLYIDNDFVENNLKTLLPKTQTANYGKSTLFDVDSDTLKKLLISKNLPSKIIDKEIINGQIYLDLTKNQYTVEFDLKLSDGGSVKGNIILVLGDYTEPNLPSGLISDIDTIETGIERDKNYDKKQELEVKYVYTIGFNWPSLKDTTVNGYLFESLLTTNFKDLGGFGYGDYYEKSFGTDSNELSDLYNFLEVLNEVYPDAIIEKIDTMTIEEYENINN